MASIIVWAVAGRVTEGEPPANSSSGKKAPAAVVKPAATAATSATRSSTTPSVAATAKTPPPANYQIFAWNDLGMHCYDSDFSVFSLLPPFNTVHAQVVKKGVKPSLASPTDVNVTFSAIADPTGSFNSTSFGKTNFWSYSAALYGAQPPVDEGLTGTKMPGLSNTQRGMKFEAGKVWTAMGLPITNLDDQFKFNAYPMMRFSATRVGETKANSTVDAVVPVSSEMDCKSCHANGKIAADDLHVQLLGLKLSAQTDPDLQSRENILRLHDIRYGTQLFDHRPVLCASCHYSPALDLAGTGPVGAQIGRTYLSRAMHLRHGKTMDNKMPTADNPPIIPDAGVQACYKCHPGNETNCLRSVMAGAGVGCQKCHGDLLAVGGQYKLTTGKVREPWKDLPKCQSCHTGDLVSNLGGAVPRLQAFASNDPAATPTLAPKSRFAEPAGVLYRNSLGHGGVACVACHGSPHAEWPATNPAANDNLTARQLQGHAGVVIECSTCHDQSLGLTMDGPHGMHNVNSQSWVKDHKTFVEKKGMASCRACHGLTLDGAYLSVTPVDRTFTIADRRSITIKAGSKVSCTLCHKKPNKP
ncbi:MAG TPA: hypothetical protein PLV92_04255 [Pirellulaceae bacterium]|nr:hypothetical protein [Pirellulaceae bacterium]